VGSVGVVAPHACLEEVRAALDGAVDATHGAALGAGVNLIDLHVAKGLEFDAVVVVEPAAILAERPDGGVGGLYTALTRSTRALAIVHARPLPDELRDAGVLRTETDRNRP
jgi:superfamily I DNA/RNA helicase